MAEDNLHINENFYNLKININLCQNGLNVFLALKKKRFIYILYLLDINTTILHRPEEVKGDSAGRVHLNILGTHLYSSFLAAATCVITLNSCCVMMMTLHSNCEGYYHLHWLTMKKQTTNLYYENHLCWTHFYPSRHQAQVKSPPHLESMTSGIELQDCVWAEEVQIDLRAILVLVPLKLSGKNLFKIKIDI